MRGDEQQENSEKCRPPGEQLHHKAADKKDNSPRKERANDMTERIYPADSEPFANAIAAKIDKVRMALDVCDVWDFGLVGGKVMVGKLSLLAVQNFRLRNTHLDR